MLAFVSSASLLGVEGHRVTVEVHASSGLPSYTIVGLPDASCRESRDRVRAALLSSEQQWPQCRLTVNLAPTGLPKAGAGLDLAIAIGILAATDKLPSERLVDHAFIGELGLDGSIRAVPGALPLVGALDCATVVVPMLCLDEARVVGRCQVLGARTLRDVIDALTDLAPWPAQPASVAAAEVRALPDLREVRGQPLARKALEVAAAGGHHLLMVGPPGAGKTMLARRLPGLLPRLDAGQSIEVSCIHSAAGLPLPDRGLVSSPPFRAPHHSASTVSLVGGGTLSLRPGEISIAQGSASLYSMTNSAVYTRISRDTEGLGLGVSRQEQACRELADARGLTVAAVFDDNDISATRGKRRPGFEAMLTAATAGEFSTIIAWHVDRITRNPRELERLIDVLEKADVTVLTVTAGALDLSTASGRMQARVVGAVARHESEQKSERLRAKASQLAAAGKLSGGGWRPYGFNADRVTVCEPEAVMIRQAAADVLAGRPVRSIVRQWHAAGSTSTTGSSWTQHSLRRTLCSARIAGLREHHGDVVATAEWPAIVDRGTWEALSRILRDPGRRMNHNPTKYLLTGMAYCGLCGKKLIARPRSDKRRCYVCATGPGLHGCGKIRVLADPFEELVAEAALIALERVDLSEAHPVDTSIGLEIADCEHRLGELADDFAAGTITRAEWLRARVGLQERLERARMTLANQTARPAALTGDIRDRWTQLDLQQRRAVVDAVIERVEVGPAVRGRNVFDPTRIGITWRG